MIRKLIIQFDKGQVLKKLLKPPLFTMRTVIANQSLVAIYSILCSTNGASQVSRVTLTKLAFVDIPFAKKLKGIRLYNKPLTTNKKLAVGTLQL